MEMHGSEARVLGDRRTGRSSDRIPPGLEAMLNTEHLLVAQKKDKLELFSEHETRNTYDIFNDDRKKVYYALEDDISAAICAQGGNRPFTIRLVDAKGKTVMIASSQVHCCTRDVQVELPPGKVFAIIKEEFAFLHPHFLVTPAVGEPLMKIVSPLQAALGSFKDVAFDVLGADMKTKIGEISKQWRGFAQEILTDADVFGLTMPADLDASWKAALLAALFLIDYTYYESS